MNSDVLTLTPVKDNSYVRNVMDSIYTVFAVTNISIIVQKLAFISTKQGIGHTKSKCQSCYGYISPFSLIIVCTYRPILSTI